MRRGVGVALGLLALAVVAAAVVASSSGPARRRGGGLDRVPSSDNPAPRGVGAAAAWLAATGRPSARLVAAADRPPTGAVWLLLAPAVPLGDADAAAVLAHAEAGHLVVWAMGDRPQPALEAALAARRLPGGGVRERLVAGAAGDPLLAGLLLRAGGPGVASDRPGARAAAGPETPPPAVTVPVGRGQVLLLGDATPLDNAHLAGDDALSLWVRLATRGPVAFDERWRTAGGRPDSARSPHLALVAAQALAVALALLLALGARLGAIRPPPPSAARRTARDYLDSLATLYRRSGAEPDLAVDTWRRLRSTLERDAGVPARLADDEAARRLEGRWPAAAAAVRRGAAALTRGGPGTLLGVARAAADAESGLHRGDAAR